MGAVYEGEEHARENTYPEEGLVFTLNAILSSPNWQHNWCGCPYPTTLNTLLPTIA